MRSLTVAALLVGLPHCSLAIRGSNPIVIDAIGMVKAYQSESRGVAEPDGETTREKVPFFSLCRELDSMIPPGEYLFDMTNQPAIHAWTHLRCPTRFYALYYGSSLEWQEDIVSRLRETETQWILWPERGNPNHTIDGIDVQLRHWYLTRYVLTSYHAERILQDGAVLLRSGSAIASLVADLRSEFFSPVYLGSVPRIWGRFEDKPLSTPWLADWTGPPSWNDPGSIFYLPIGHRYELPIDMTYPADLEISFESGWNGRLEVQAGDPGQTPPLIFSFDVSADHVGPYRIPLSSFAGWVWGDYVHALRFSWINNDGDRNIPRIRAQLYR